MKHSTVIAIDLAKDVFQVCKTDRYGNVIYNKKMTRKQLQELLVREKSTLVALESCNSSNYWTRFAKAQGHEVKAIAPRAVTPYRQGQKTDANDAQAIATAAWQVNVKSCRTLSVEEQCHQSVIRMRDLAIRQKVKVGNQLRAFLLEFGYPVSKGDRALRVAIPEVLEDAENEFTAGFRTSLELMFGQFKLLIEQIETLTFQMNQIAAQDRLCQRLQALEGVGPVCASLLKLALGQQHFRKGREASACIGLTPVQHSSGGKQKIGSISKRSGHNALRSALYQGAITVVYRLEKRPPKTEKERWVQSLSVRRGKKVAAIALANKTVRTAFAMLKHDQEYKSQPIELAV